MCTEWSPCLWVFKAHVELSLGIPERGGREYFATQKPGGLVWSTALPTGPGSTGRLRCRLGCMDVCAACLCCLACALAWNVQMSVQMSVKMSVKMSVQRVFTVHVTSV